MTVRELFTASDNRYCNTDIITADGETIIEGRRLLCNFLENIAYDAYLEATVKRWRIERLGNGSSILIVETDYSYPEA